MIPDCARCGALEQFYQGHMEFLNKERIPQARQQRDVWPSECVFSRAERKN